MVLTRAKPIAMSARLHPRKTPRQWSDSYSGDRNIQGLSPSFGRCEPVLNVGSTIATLQQVKIGGTRT
jgi:hypothetical protein